jgi:hypothetical protein
MSTHGLLNALSIRLQKTKYVIKNQSYMHMASSASTLFSVLFEK